MKEQLTQEKIWRKISELNKNEATELLISLFDGSQDEITRINAINTFEKLNFKSTKMFTVFENCLISDENQIVRSVAAKLLIKNYFKKGLKSLIWAIQHDKSPIVMKTFINALRENENDNSVLLKEDLFNWLKILASNIEIVPEEAEFILDVEILFAKGKKNYNVDGETYKFYRHLRDITRGEPWIEITNNHVVGLYLNYFNWQFLKENPEFAISLSRLRYPNMFLNSLRKIKLNANDTFEVPDSIGLLTSLKWLNLSHNNIQKIPESLGRLKSLKKLDLSHNNIQKFPNSLESFFKSLESFKI